MYRAIAVPKPSKGISFAGIKSIVVPDQSYSLKEILQRFTRGESMPVLHEGRYDETTDIDLEKVKHLDLVDKHELIQQQKTFRAQHQEKETARLKAEAEKTAAAQKAQAEKEFNEAVEKRANEILRSAK